MNSNDKSHFPYRRTSCRPSRYALTTAAAAAALGVAVAGCGGPDTGARTEGKSKTASEERTGTRVLWVDDSLTGAEAPALRVALKAGGVELKDASSDGGGTVVDGSEEITKKIAADRWKQLAKGVESFRPTVVAYQITTYDWGSEDQQRVA